jgi:hypothetical protein
MMVSALSLGAIEPAVPDPQKAVEKMASPLRVEREAATKSLAQWAMQQPSQAKRTLIPLFQQHPEPEVRERCRFLLKAMAAQDYHRMGEGYLGISMGQEWEGVVTGDSAKRFGLVITGISEGSPAALAKLQVGDVIVSLADQTWRKSQEIIDPEHGLSAKIRAAGAGKEVVLGVWRHQQFLSCKAMLTRRPRMLDQWQPQMQPNGAMKWDQAEWQKQIDEEKKSAEYFQEWLEMTKKEISVE